MHSIDRIRAQMKQQQKRNAEATCQQVHGCSLAEKSIRDRLDTWLTELTQPGADPLVFILRKLAELEQTTEQQK